MLKMNQCEVIKVNITDERNVPVALPKGVFRHRTGARERDLVCSHEERACEENKTALSDLFTWVGSDKGRFLLSLYCLLSPQIIIIIMPGPGHVLGG